MVYRTLSWLSEWFFGYIWSERGHVSNCAEGLSLGSSTVTRLPVCRDVRRNRVYSVVAVHLLAFSSIKPTLASTPPSSLSVVLLALLYLVSCSMFRIFLCFHPLLLPLPLVFVTLQRSSGPPPFSLGFALSPCTESASSYYINSISIFQRTLAVKSPFSCAKASTPLGLSRCTFLVPLA